MESSGKIHSQTHEYRAAFDNLALMLCEAKDRHRREFADRIIEDRALWGVAREYFPSNGTIMSKEFFRSLPNFAYFNSARVSLCFTGLENRLLHLSRKRSVDVAKIEDVLNAIYKVVDQFAELNLPLLIDYMSNRGLNSLSAGHYDDLLEIGRKALRASSHSYDYKIGCKYSYYAYRYLRSRIEESLSKGMGRKTGGKKWYLLVSLDEEAYRGSENDKKSVLKDKHGLDFEREIIGRDMLRKLEDSLELFPADTRDIIRMRASRASWEDIAEKFGFSRQGVIDKKTVVRKALLRDPAFAWLRSRNNSKKS